MAEHRRVHSTPQGLKPQYIAELCGTGELVPFPFTVFASRKARAKPVLAIASETLAPTLNRIMISKFSVSR
jgi:hypothetical protein